MKFWEHILHYEDVDLAEALVDDMLSDNKIPWKDLCERLEYPFELAFPIGLQNQHFRRVVADIRLLARKRYED